MEFTNGIGEEYNNVERKRNKYPEIMLSDCIIKNIEIKGENIVANFDEYGFFIKDSEKGKYYRTDSAQIVIKKCDMENIAIKEIRTQKLSEELFFDSIYDVEFKKCLTNINMGRWKFEIVEEFYSTRRALYIGQVREKDKSFWLCVKIQFEELLYLWNNIRYDCPF